MSYQRPTLSTLITRVSGDVSSRTEGSAFFEDSPERFIAIALATMGHGLHGHVEWASKQLLPTTADEEALTQWGSMLEVSAKPATKSTGDATFTGANGSELPVGASVKADNGQLYSVLVGGTVNAGVVVVTLEALDTGTASNLLSGAKVALVSPVAGIDSVGTVSGDGLVTGADTEDVEDYRPRVIDELRNPESAGGPGSYEKWALSVPGVTRAWEIPHRMGVGTVAIAFVMDDRPSIIPTVADVAAVQAKIVSLRPIDMACAYVAAPIAKIVNIAIALQPNTVAVQNAVTQELRDLFRTEVDFMEALPQSLIDEAISTAQGEVAHDITAIGSLEPGDWEILTLGAITFTTFGA